MTPIPMVDLAARHEAVAVAVESRVQSVLRSGAYVGGATVAEVEELVAGWFRRKGAVGVASGTDALMLGLQALGVRAGDEVIVPALSFFATAGAVAAIGAHPVIVDVGPDGLLDPAAAAASVGPLVRAVIPVHLFGNVAPDPDIGLSVLDDAAQAVGSTPTPSVGQLTAVSAYPTKTWGAAGDAGFVVGDDLAALQRVKSLGNHGRGPIGAYASVSGATGRASRLDALQAAVLLGHAPSVAARVLRRRAIAAHYDRGLPASVVPFPRQAGSAVHQYSVLVEQRDQVMTRLAAQGVGCAVYYPRTLDQEPALSTARAEPTPVARHLAGRLLALPIRATLTDDEADRVLAAMHEACP